jgi:hypothetical protein
MITRITLQWFVCLQTPHSALPVSPAFLTTDMKLSIALSPLHAYSRLHLTETRHKYCVCLKKKLSYL